MFLFLDLHTQNKKFNSGLIFQTLKIERKIKKTALV